MIENIERMILKENAYKSGLHRPGSSLAGRALAHANAEAAYQSAGCA